MPNKGLLLNYRDTLKSCKGKYLAFCAGDDYWNDPEKLQKQVSFLEKNPDYGLVHTDSNYYYEKENIFINNNRAGQKSTITDGFVFEALLTRKFEISALTACYTKKYIDDFVDFEEFRRAGLAYEDYPTWLELSRHTKFKYLDESTATYRVIANSISRPSDVKKKFSFLEDKNKIRRYFLEKYHVGKEMKDRIEELYYLQKFDLAYKYRNKEAAVDSYAFLNKRGIADMKMKVKNMLIGAPVLYGIVDKLNAIVKTKQSRLRSS
jgi:glycosyltransferase involved in cell wall biosynthesis